MQSGKPFYPFVAVARLFAHPHPISEIGSYGMPTRLSEAQRNPF